MKVHLIDIYLLLQRSMSIAQVKVKYESHIYFKVESCQGTTCRTHELMHKRTHIHRTVIVTIMSRSPQAAQQKWLFLWYSLANRSFQHCLTKCLQRLSFCTSQQFCRSMHSYMQSKRLSAMRAE